MSLRTQTEEKMVSSSAKIRNKDDVCRHTERKWLVRMHTYLCVVYLIFGELHISGQFLHCDPEGREPGAKVTHHLSCQGLHGCHINDLGKCGSGGEKGGGRRRKERREERRGGRGGRRERGKRREERTGEEEGGEKGGRGGRTEGRIKGEKEINKGQNKLANR